jgi:hypothetical protein
MVIEKMAASLAGCIDHIGFPKGLHDHLAEGWEGNHLSPLKKSLH